MTTVPRNQEHPHYRPQYSSSYELDSMTYDPDPSNSPLMTPVHPKFEPSPSPPLDIPLSQIRPLSGDPVLLRYLDGGRRPEIAQAAGNQALPAANSEDNDDDEDDETCANDESRPDSHYYTESTRDLTSSKAPMNKRNNLQAVAHNALQATDILASTHQLSINDPQPREPPISNRFNVADNPTSSIMPPPPGGLPPLQAVSRHSNDTLPSLRSALGVYTPDLVPPAGGLSSHINSSGQSYVHSPTRAMLRPYHSPPPISPNENNLRSFPSSHRLSSTSPLAYNHPSVEYTSNTLDEKLKSNPPILTSVMRPTQDRMSLNGIIHPQLSQNPQGTPNSHTGSYACTVPGCSAQPFQTQYLLNSHANVHSSNRPHYCPVKGCVRSEGGKGFKRKNEMIRHGLVHDSPGYVCPFCADREHKYPRPDNLQRHVRVHHVDKNKDDPLLRDVLSQRPDGPNRGRRRRGAL